MSIFTKKEIAFLNLLDSDIFIESSKSDRKKALDKTIKLLESKGYAPKISKPNKEGWINKCDSGTFGESLCISIGKIDSRSLCSEINKELKSLNAKLSPDNYGTVFLSMKDSGEVYTESYIGNYFTNKILLYKLRNNPELNRKTLIKFIKNITIKYEESLLDEEVQKISNKKDVGEYYSPLASLSFSDGKEITVAVSYDKKSFTPGAAFSNGEEDVLLLYPSFFKDDIELQLFTLMHEIGHIRLGHCDLKNQPFKQDKRSNVMVNGRCVYPELNADLYAILNGAKMYTILQEAINEDYDKKFDYRYTNNELSKRYIHVLKNYKKLRPIYEYVESNAEIGEFEIEKEWYVKHNGHSNPCVKIKGIDKPLRGRSEVLIIKDDEVFICFKPNGEYRLPGGGWDENEPHIKSAIREAKEEARITCENLEYIISRVAVDDAATKRCKDEKIPEKDWWYGWYTEVYVAEYDKKFNGHIDEEDKDNNMVKNGKFYPISEMMEKFYPDHKKAINRYLGNKEFKESKNEDPNQEILNELTHVVKWCRMDSSLFCNIEPLDKPIIHKSKNNGEMLLLATLRHISKKSSEEIRKTLHENVRYNGERVDFHTCYLPGDVFVYINIPDTKVKPTTESSDIYDETYIDDFIIDDEYFLETATDSHHIVETLYTNIEEVLNTPTGDKLFKRYVEEFVDRNTEKLHEPCPISMIAFTDIDKAKFFDLFNFDEKELIKSIGKAVSMVSDTAQFKLVKQNPIFSVFYCVLRYYILKNDQAGINSTLVIHALASYPSVFSKYFKYGANAGVMKYTADNLTEKFIFKQEGHVFGALRKSIESAYTFLKPYFKDASDKEIIRYIQRIRNDQNSMIKKIANEYNKNFKAGKTVSTQSETYDTGALIDEYSNDTSKVETISQKVIINMLTNGIDLRILETASAMAQLSITELRLYLTKILIDSRSTELEEFINSVLFIYLFDEKHDSKEIKSRAFLSYGIDLFRRTNSNNKNVVTIKSLLNKWAEETGIHSKYRREPTRISYKKGIFWYILLTIQTNA